VETVSAALLVTALVAVGGRSAGDGLAMRSIAAMAASSAAETSLERLIAAQVEGKGLLPSADHEDALAIPVWFRVLLRKRLSGLPTAGSPQYPREALLVLSWLQAHPNAPDAEQARRIEDLEQYVARVAADNQRAARYPKEWDRPTPPGTALDALRQKLERRLDLLPERDLEDRSPLPPWFRVYLRQQFPELARSGPYQYPRTANRILQRLLDHPNSVEPPR
jgi:hypothetical protein